MSSVSRWFMGAFSTLYLVAPAVMAGDSVQHVEAKACKQCHEEIYAQWEGSMHANSSALKDPIHGAFYKNVIGDPTKEGVKTKKGRRTCPRCLSSACS